MKTKPKKTSTPTPEEIVAMAFSEGRAPRSAEYREGMRQGLACQRDHDPITCPYAQGTVQFDAFFAGVDGGRTLWAHQYATR